MSSTLALLALRAALPVGIAAIAVILFVIWRRDDRLRSQRELMRRAYELGEEILGSSSAEQILEKVRRVGPAIFGVTNVRVYLHNRHARTLDPAGPAGRTQAPIPLAAPPAGPQAGAAACFHYRTLLAIPDTSRSPFPVVGQPGSDAPRSLLFVPMLVQGEVLGILEMDQQDRARVFSRDEQALAQHLANQMGVAVKLLDQRAMQEQLYRTEKLAAVGQLVSGIVNDLHAPLAAIANLAQSAGANLPRRTDDELTSIAAEAQRAMEIVNRLVGFAPAGQAQSESVNLNELLSSLIEFRQREWKLRGIEGRSILAEESMIVLGARGQLEQAFLSLLVHAEQSLSETSEKRITVRTSPIGRRVLVEIAYSGPLDEADPFSVLSHENGKGPGLGICRSMIAGHGGEIRLVHGAAAGPAFQVELPRSSREPSSTSAAGQNGEHAHTLTALLIEPADTAQAQLRALLAARGYRVVPVNSTDEGVDLAQRLRFDAVFCSLHAPGLNWIETSEHLKTRVGGFVLLSDSYSASLSTDFESNGSFVLAKPIDERQLDRVLAAIHATPRSRPLARP